MKRLVCLIALLATGCATMEPAYVQPNPAIPASWPTGDPYLAQAEIGLPTLTYQQVFQDARLQTLIAQALVNNRDMMVAASNIAAAREQYRIQRADLLPTVNANAGVTLSGDKDNNLSAQYQLGASVPSFELDLFGRVRSLTKVQLERYLATEAGATGPVGVGSIVILSADFTACDHAQKGPRAKCEKDYLFHDNLLPSSVRPEFFCSYKKVSTVCEEALAKS